MDKRKEIGNTLKKIRTANEFSMSSIAKMAGITRAQFTSIERSSANYTIDTLLRVTDVLNCQLKIEQQFKCIVCDKKTAEFDGGICEDCLNNEKF